MDLSATLDAIVAAAIAYGRIVGSTVQVAQRGTMLYKQAAGLADREANRPVKFDTIFRLASITKPMVSITALAMADEGRLSLDDAVANHLPYFTPKYRGRTPAIRLRHLLSHTSGLSYRYDEAEISCGLGDTDRDFQTNFTALAGRELNFEPGTAWEYSVATDVLGAVVASAFGGTLEQAVAHYITGPLGMVDTAFHVTDPSRLAAAYVNGKSGAERMSDHYVYVDEDNRHLHFSPARAFNSKAFQSGGAGMVGTASDIFKFYDLLRAGAPGLLKPETIAAASTNQIGDIWREPGTKFSFFGSLTVDPKTANNPHSPGTLGWGGIYGHNWFIDPVKGLTVLVMTNTTPEGSHGPFINAIRDAVQTAIR